MDYLKRSNVKYLRGIIVTHLHLDHFSDVVALLENSDQLLGLTCERLLYHPKFQQKVIVDSDNHSEEANSKQAQRIREEALRSLIKWAQIHSDKCNDLVQQSGVAMPLPGIIELLHPRFVDISELTLSNLNNVSGVIRVTGLGCNALLMGDLQSVGWSYLKKQNISLQNSILKFPHHGAWEEKEIADLLETIDPSIVVISVGTQGERYGHPNQHVLNSIASRAKTRLMCTQATSRCEMAVDSKRSIVIEEYKKWATNPDNYFIDKGSGCPCAGTVIVELGNEPVVLQPRNEFHRNNIILHFDKPQCLGIF